MSLEVPRSNFSLEAARSNLSLEVPPSNLPAPPDDGEKKTIRREKAKEGKRRFSTSLDAAKEVGAMMPTCPLREWSAVAR